MEHSTFTSVRAHFLFHFHLSASPSLETQEGVYVKKTALSEWFSFLPNIPSRQGALSPSGQVEMMYVFLVAGLSYDTNETVLKDAFGQHGEIIEVKVICDHVSGKSKGYGFVHFTSETLATTALKEMDNQVCGDWQCNLMVASLRLHLLSRKLPMLSGG
ncbi:hypothetical protein L1049_013360 [Liquidambar formosana]|uniref:RRM domain-containing protein n=1 Tax=Liquidambar formosana TaxID=63359 RepID=A0AAP0RP47_LIQFO